MRTEFIKKEYEIAYIHELISNQSYFPQIDINSNGDVGNCGYNLNLYNYFIYFGRPNVSVRRLEQREIVHYSYIIDNNIHHNLYNLSNIDELSVLYVLPNYYTYNDLRENIYTGDSQPGAQKYKKISISEIIM